MTGNFQDKNDHTESESSIEANQSGREPERRSMAQEAIKLIRHPWAGRTALLVATGIPHYIMLSDAIILYLALGWAVIYIPVPGLNWIAAIAITIMAIPLAVDLIFVSPVLTGWILLRRNRTPRTIVRIQQGNMLIIAVLALLYCAGTAFFSLKVEPIDVEHPFNQPVIAAVLAAGSLCALLSAWKTGD